MNMRRQVFVEKTFQLRFARFTVLLTAGGALVTALVVFYTIYFILGEMLARVYPQSHLISLCRTLHLALAVSLLVVLPFIYFAAIIFSHRIAGPLPKIYRALREIGEGRFDTKLTLREHDQLKELADVINETAAKLRERYPS